MRLPGIFPPVWLNGRPLIDGGVINNTPISRAIDAGASEVWVLSTGHSCSLPEAPTGAVAMGMHAVALLVQQRLTLELASRVYPVPVHIVPAPCPITVTPIDFSESAELIDRAHAGTTSWLEAGCPAVMPEVGHFHPVASG